MSDPLHRALKGGPRPRRRGRGAALRALVVLAAGLFAVGCTRVGPDYVPPEVEPPGRWKAELAEGLSAKPADPDALAAWWRALDDPSLSALMDRAVAGNPGLAEAQARVREARARRGVSGAERFPTLQATGSAATSRTSGSAGTTQWQNLYATGFDAAWEADLFGGVQRAVEAAQADLEAREVDFRDVLVSLLAEVALNYVEFRTFQARLAVAEATLREQVETHQLVGWRVEAGLAPTLELEQARFNLESTRARIPALRSGIEQARNRLAVLLGDPPGSLRPLRAEAPVPVAPLEIAVGVPAETLRRRPDVRRAERELAAQTARIGVATADLYPRFTLLGSVGLEALSDASLSAATRTDRLSAGFSWSLFDGGAIRQNIEVQDALQEQALKRYEAALLVALEEVENALVAYAQEQQRRKALTEATRAAERAVELARQQYASGLIDFQSVLDSERSLLSFQDQLVQSEGQAASDLIGLYKALGGGWSPGPGPAMAD